MKVGVRKQKKGNNYLVVNLVVNITLFGGIVNSREKKSKKMVRLQFQLIVLRLQFFLVYSGLIDRRSIANKILWELQKLFD